MDVDNRAWSEVREGLKEIEPANLQNGTRVFPLLHLIENDLAFGEGGLRCRIDYANSNADISRSFDGVNTKRLTLRRIDRHSSQGNGVALHLRFGDDGHVDGDLPGDIVKLQLELDVTGMPFVDEEHRATR